MVAKNTWKPVEIDGNLLEGDGCGLIGIEECTDYDLNEILGSKKRKRKPVIISPKLVHEEEEVDDDEETYSDDVDQEDNNVEGLHLVKLQQPPAKKKKSVAKLNKEIQQRNLAKIQAKKEAQAAQNATKLNMKAWDIAPIPEQILKALAEQKFQQPTDIQRLTLPAAILGKRDILGAAETGSGKTLAFGIPILNGIMKLKQNEEPVEEDSDFDEREEELDDLNEDGLGCVKAIDNVEVATKINKPLYALVLTPTRELAVQVREHLVKAAKHTGIKVAVVVGGLAAVKQERLLSKCPEIVVATPGRLWELIQQGNEHLSKIADVRFLAIDETDRMLERGHFQELHEILERLNTDETKRRQRQNFVFSATLTLIHELPRHLLTKKKLHTKKRVADMTPAQKLKKVINMLGITDPKVVDITDGKGTSHTLTECRITCTIDEKDFYLYYFLLRHPGRTLVFCNSIGCVKRLASLLKLLACEPLPLHASMPQRQRLKNLDRFKEKSDALLIATDVAARGLDIPSVDQVIHYQTPRTSESYVHRSGRTARASKEGITVLLVEPGELQSYLRLCRTLGKSEDIPQFPVESNFLKAVKQRVALAREVDKLQLKIGRTDSEMGWLEKAAEDMDIIVDDEFLKEESKEMRALKKPLEVKRKQLIKLLEKPVFPKGFSAKYPLASDPQYLAVAQGDVATESAVEVMKSELEKKKVVVGRKRPKTMFQPKVKVDRDLTSIKEMKNVKKGKGKKRFNNNNKKKF